MASSLKNLSDTAKHPLPDLSNFKIGIVCAEWNEEVTSALEKGCRKTLEKAGLKKKNLLVLRVPGSFELPGGAKMLVENKKVDAVVCLGCVIRGETPHFDFISEAVAHGIMELNLRYHLPFIFGVLTTDTLQQALDRSGGAHGNKGVEAAVTAMRMLELRKSLVK